MNDLHEQHMNRGKGKRSLLSLSVTNNNQDQGGEGGGEKDFNGIKKHKDFFLPFEALFHTIN